MTDEFGNTLSRIVTELQDLLAPLRNIAEDPDELGRFLARAGWSAPLLFDVDLSAVASAIRDLEDRFEELQNADTDQLDGVLDTLVSVGDAIQGFDALRDALTAGLAGDPPAEILTALTEDIVNQLLLSYLGRRSPLAYQLLYALTLIEREVATPVGFDNILERLPVERPALKLENLSRLFQDPVAQLRSAYLPGPLQDDDAAAAFVEQLGDRIGPIVFLSGGTAAFGLANPDLLDPVEAARLQRSALLAFGTPSRRVGALVEVIPRGASGDLGLPGPALELEPIAGTQLNIPVGDWMVEFAAEGSALRIFVSPGDFAADAGDGRLDWRLGLSRGRGGAPALLLGSSQGTRLQIGQFATRAYGVFSDQEVDFGGELELSDSLLAIAAGDGDGFLAKVLPADGIEAPFELLFGWSRGRGVYFDGGAGLELTLHINESLGPLFVRTLDLGVFIDPEGLEVRVAVVGGLEVGPLVAVVEEIGLRGKIHFNRKGMLGNADLTLGFKPPIGVGLSMDTGSVTLGGYVSFDPDNERYAGAVEILIEDSFGLTAICLITTRLPDGGKGFSMLFIVTVELPAPIHLAYNIFFAGAGGLLGLNRSVDLDQLRSGVQSGTIDNILFPADVIANIDTIVTDLRAVFPPERDQFLVGPMLKLTWNNPALITAELGLIIEFASPWRIAILGVLRAALPSAEEPILDLKVNFLGTIDFEKGLLTFDASIYDSYIGRGSLKFYIEGDMALRISWGAKKDFVQSVGGFHPQYSPDAYLKLPRTMKRLSISLLKDNPRLKLSTYFAITSNTVQFGARLEFYFKVSKFSVVGDFGFDVLFQFNPFKFLAHAWAQLAVKSGSRELLCISLDFDLAGPTPWIAKGTARFKILFVKIEVEFEKTFGERRNLSLPDVALMPLLIEEFERDANWKSELRDIEAQPVHLLESQLAGRVFVDAGASLTLSQTVLPLDTGVTLFGNRKPSDLRRAGVREIRFGDRAVATRPVYDDFAPAQFDRHMGDRDKLRASAYESRVSGVEAYESALGGSYVRARTVEYERLVQDYRATDLERQEPIVSNEGRRASPRAEFERLAAAGAVARSPLSLRRRRQRERGSVVDVQVEAATFTLVNAVSFGPLDTLSRNLTKADAEARRRELIESGADAEDLVVLPDYQLAS